MEMTGKTNGCKSAKFLPLLRDEAFSALKETELQQPKKTAKYTASLVLCRIESSPTLKHLFILLFPESFIKIAYGNTAEIAYQLVHSLFHDCLFYFFSGHS